MGRSADDSAALDVRPQPIPEILKGKPLFPMATWLVKQTEIEMIEISKEIKEVPCFEMNDQHCAVDVVVCW